MRAIGVGCALEALEALEKNSETGLSSTITTDTHILV